MAGTSVTNTDVFHSSDSGILSDDGFHDIECLVMLFIALWSHSWLPIVCKDKRFVGLRPRSLSLIE